MATTSLITKKRIAKAFKTLLKDKEFDKVSVVDIMELAEIRRQTFYNHFLDKYELMDWIFEHELEEQVTDNLTYISGFNLLEELLLYLDNNKTFYRQAFDIKGQNDFSSFFLNYCLVLMDKIMTEQGQVLDGDLDPDYARFLTDYHANALVTIIKTKLTQDQAFVHQDFNHLIQIITASLIRK